MENNLAIDFSMFVTSLKTLRDNLTYVEMDSILSDIKDANDRGKLDEFLSQVEYMHSKGTDLATSFHYALFDIVQEQGEDF